MKYYEAVIGSKYMRNKFAKAGSGSLLNIDMFAGKDVEAYVSCFMYPEEVVDHLNTPPKKIRGYSGHIVTDHLYWDFDSDNDVTLAYSDAQELIEKLSSLGVDTDDILIRYSGRKGFHVILPCQDVADLGLRKDLNFVVKKTCLEIASELGTCDDSVYNKTGIIRVRNSKHPSTGNYCIPLEVEEFLGNSVEAIISMAKSKKEFTGRELVPKSYPQIREKLRVACQVVKENPKAERKTSFGKLTNGIMQGFEDGEGNTGMTSYAGYLHSLGAKQEIIYAALSATNSLWAKPMDPSKLMEIVQSVSRYPVKVKEGEVVQGAKKGRLLTMREGRDRWVAQKLTHEDIYTGFHNLNDMFYTFDPGKLCIIAGYSGLGKGHSNDKLLPQSDGGFIRVGDIVPGDDVIGADGNKIFVEGVYPLGKKQMFAVEFNDGTIEKVTDEHLWSIKKLATQKDEVRSTIYLMDYIEKQSKLVRPIKPSVQLCKPVVFDKKDLPVDPWLVGVFIGDGCISQGSRITNQEEDIANRVLALEDASWNGITIHVRGIKERLKDIGLYGKRSWEKTIPREYETSTIEDRLQLLQGLCDTDGYVSSGSAIEYSTASKTLANQIVKLVKSLGGKASMYLKEKPTYSYKGETKIGRPSYRIYFRLFNDMCPVSSIKHMKKFVYKAQRKRLYIESIVPLDEYCESTCIKVSAGDSLYLTDNFIVTHNTNFGLQIARNICLSQGEFGTFISLEMGIEALFFRASVIEESKDKDKVGARAYTEQLLSDEKRRDEVCEAWDCLFVADEAALSVEGISSFQDEAQERAKELGSDAGLMIVDYAELIANTDDEKKLANAVKYLKDEAKRKKIRMILLAQFNRTGGDEYAEPFQNSIRGSAGIYNTADLMLGMWRDSKNDKRIHIKDMKNRDDEKNQKFDLVQHGLAYDEEDYLEDKTEDVANSFYIPRESK